MSEPTRLPQTGDVLAGKYRIDRTIGEGGMGFVYEAFHLRLRQRVAIKMLKPSVLAHPTFVARFEREARAAATLESDQVAKVIDVDTSPDGVPYMVIELLEGNDLGEELERRGRFPVEEAVVHVMDACVPIAQAHAMGIIHRDLKPSNLFLAKKGNERVLKLLDFGISKVLAEADSKDTSSFSTLGTPHYMSPEHIRCAADVDRRSDIWSLGVILYELLTGSEPFRGDPTRVIASIVADPIPPPRSRRPDIPEALERVIMRALEKDPQKRYPDVRAFAEALAPFAPEQELVLTSRAQRMPTPTSISPKPVPAETIAIPRAPRRAVARAAGALVVMVAAIGIVSWWTTRSDAGSHPPSASITQPVPQPTAARSVTTHEASTTEAAPTASSAASPVTPPPKKPSQPAAPARVLPVTRPSASALPFQL